MHSRISKALATAVVISGAGAAVAFAHPEVKSTYPKKGASATTRISSVSVTFTGTIRSGTIKVTGPGGKTFSKGKGGRDPRNVKRLKVPLKGGKPKGTYKASWTLKAADGHTQKGSFSFKLK